MYSSGMILVPFKDAEKSRFGDHSSGAILSRYRAKGQRLALSRAEIVNRFPVKGDLRNGARTLTLYVISGEGDIVIGKIATAISEGDIVRVSANERFFLTADTTLSLLTTPPLDPKR
jgi:hypothetical protein